MKNIFFIVLFLYLVSFYSFSQNKDEMSLECSYEKEIDFSKFTYINLGEVGEKFLLCDNSNLGQMNFEFYNLNHDLYKSISLDFSLLLFAADAEFISQNIYNISNNLFDLDDEIEFLISFTVIEQDWGGGSSTMNTYIAVVDENNDAILKVPGFLNISTGITNENDCIVAYSTEDGVKMIIKRVQNNLYYYDIYELPGTLSENVKIINKDLFSLNNYPNPVSDNSYIEFTLPNYETTATFLIFDINGKLVYDEQLFSNEGIINLNVEGFQPGVYTYIIKNQSGSVITNKVIKIN